MPRTPQQMEELLIESLKLLGMFDAFIELNNEGRPATLELANQRLDLFKAECKKAKIALALKHHPDKGGDPDMMAKINNAFDIVNDLQPIPEAPPPPRIVIVFHGGGSATWSPFSTSTSTGSTGFGDW